MLRTKCILLPPTKGDGLRISVLSRHTLEDGFGWPYDLWLRDLAPLDYLIKRRCTGEISLAHYTKEYLEYLQEDKIAAIVIAVAKYALHKRVTLLGKEFVPTLCHRTILLWECVQHEPDIHIQNF